MDRNAACDGSRSATPMTTRTEIKRSTSLCAWSRRDAASRVQAAAIGDFSGGRPDHLRDHLIDS